MSALLATTACGTGDGSETADADRTPGERLYAFNCGACHGESALGDGPLAANLPVPPPPLFEHLGHHPMDQLVRIIQTGVPPAMPPASLEEAEVLEIVDYLWSLVPDSMVAELREMQRMAEMGMEMNTDSPPDGGEMDHESMGHGATPDTTPR
jgi:mono/diheme cytochrome c family protein